MPNTVSATSLCYHDDRAWRDSANNLPFWRTNRAHALRAYTREQAGNAQFLGFELEVDKFPSRRASDTALTWVAENFRAQKYCRLDSDGSLHTYGWELVSAPMTLDAHRAAHWETALAKIEECGGRSHDAGTCGLHVHVSRAALGNDDRAKQLALGKIMEMLERFQVEFEKLGRRRFGGWADETGYGHSLTDGSRAIRRKSARIQDEQGIDVHDTRRYKALNLQNRSTVEFRFPNGTLKPDTLYATLALIDGLVRFCKTHTTPDIHSTTFDSFIAWVNDEKLTAYWAERRDAQRPAR